MAQTYCGGFISCVATGVSFATGAASAAQPIPVAADGNRPRYILVTARNECYVKIGGSGVAATANDSLVQPADSRILHVPNGVTHIAAIQGVSAGLVNVVPLENQ